MLKRILESSYFKKIIRRHPIYKKTAKISNEELLKSPKRFDFINFLLKQSREKTKNYLEVGVRNPADNFDKIIATKKFSVDPGVEFRSNPVDFPMTSNDFFDALREGRVLNPEIRFDVIFIDGLHEAQQVEEDIENSLNFIRDDGFIVLHDCNPPSEYHARENMNFTLSPAMKFWNGSTWKAFCKARTRKDCTGCCIDSDWGLGVLTKRETFERLSDNRNPFFEFKVFNENRKKLLNLISFDQFKEEIKK